MDQEEMASSETDDMKTMPSESVPMPSQEPIVVKVPSPITNMICEELAQGLEVLVICQYV